MDASQCRQVTFFDNDARSKTRSTLLPSSATTRDNLLGRICAIQADYEHSTHASCTTPITTSDTFISGPDTNPDETPKGWNEYVTPGDALMV